MADFEYSNLSDAYDDFEFPIVRLIVDGKELSKEENLMVTGLDVDLTSGYEASVATVTLAGSYNSDSKSFDVEKTKKYMLLGSSVVIATGYGNVSREIFRGFIARVHFIIPPAVEDEIPSVEVTAMDAKGLMMANRHSKRLKAKFYSDAVKEVLETNTFLSQKDEMGNDFTVLNITDTPDKQEGQGESGTTDRRVEMVEESDYEFIVKAAKKFNFEFFIVGNNLYFIEAKKNTAPLIVLTPACGLGSLDVGYDISGIVRSVEVRNINMEDGKFLGNTKKTTTKISLGNKAKPLVEKQSLVYIDPTAKSKDDAGYRAQYLMDTIDYRFGSINASFTGLPEVVPGRFVTISGFGEPLDNDFYLKRVRHMIGSDSYRMQIEGVANSIKQ